MCRTPRKNQLYKSGYFCLILKDSSLLIKRFYFVGFCENARVLEWILRRVDNEDIADPSPIGYIPKPGSINIDGLGDIDMKGLMTIPKSYWQEELGRLKKYYEEQFNEDLPAEIWNQFNALQERINKIPE